MLKKRLFQVTMLSIQIHQAMWDIKVAQNVIFYIKLTLKKMLYIIYIGDI